jgi:hypothetical protein
MHRGLMWQRNSIVDSADVSRQCNSQEHMTTLCLDYCRSLVVQYVCATSIYICCSTFIILYIYSLHLYKMFRSHIVDSMGTTSTGKGVHLGDKDATGIAKALRRAV